MVTQPLRKNQVAQLTVGHGYAPKYLNRAQRRSIQKKNKNKNLNKLFSTMARNQTLDVDEALQADKVKTIVDESFDETKAELAVK